MLTGMAWSGVIVGLLVLFHALKLGWRAVPAPSEPLRPDPPSLVYRSLVAWSAALSLALYMATVPTKPPFSPGQLMGQGFLFGAVLLCAAVAVLGRLQRGARAAGDPGAERAVHLAAAACALVSVNLVLQAWGRQADAPLMGLAMAAALFGIIVQGGMTAFYGAVRKKERAADQSATRSRDDAADAAGGEVARTWGEGGFIGRLSLFTLTLAVATILAGEHFGHEGQLWSIPVALGAATLLAAAVGDAVGTLLGVRRRYLPVAAVTGLIVAALAAFIVVGAIFRRLPCAWSYGVGLVTMGLAAWLLASRGPGGCAEARLARGLQDGVLSALLVIAGYVIAFRLNAGLGVALALLGGWVVGLVGSGERGVGEDAAGSDGTGAELPPASAAGDATTAPRAPLAGEGGLFDPLLTLGLLFVLIRVALERIGMPTGPDVAIHYTYTGIALGAITPLLWVCYTLGTVGVAARRLGSRTTAGTGAADGAVAGAASSIMARTAWLGLTVVAAPLVLAVLWTERSAVGFVLGLLLAQLFLAVLARVWQDARSVLAGSALLSLTPGVLSAGCVIAAAQLLHLVAPLTATPRPIKAVVAGVVVAILVAWVPLGRMKAGSPPAGAEEGAR